MTILFLLAESHQDQKTNRRCQARYQGFHLNNINTDSGIEILEAWMPTVKKHNNRRAVTQRTVEDRNALITAVEKKPTNHCGASCYIRGSLS